MITVAASFGLTANFLPANSNVLQIVLEDVTSRHGKRTGAINACDLSYSTLKEPHFFVNPFIAEADRTHNVRKRTFLD